MKTMSSCQTLTSLKKPSWFLDWTGRAAAVVASGPSIRKEEVASLRGRLPVIAIKENYDLAPWADVVYGCDASWWRNRNGLTKYGGLKVSFSQELRVQFPDVKLVSLGKHDDVIRLEPPWHRRLWWKLWVSGSQPGRAVRRY